MSNKFDNRLKSIPQSIWLKLTELESLRGKWIGSTKLSYQLMGKLRRSVLVTSTGSSTRIEGSRLADHEIENLIKGVDITKFSSRDQQEVRGYYELLDHVFSSHDGLRFTEGLIKHFHQELLKYTSKDELHRGKYKKSENTVMMIGPTGEDLGVLFATTRAYLTPKEMQELVEWTSKALAGSKHHPILVIANFVVEFLNIHPFSDGNGRLSRILANLLLLQHDYQFIPYVSHEKLIEERKSTYYLALRQTQQTLRTEQVDLIPWLEFFIDILLTQAKQAIDLLNQENLESTLSPSQLKVWEYLSNGKLASPQEIAKATSIPRPTINQVTNKLIELGQIERIGQGSTTKYQKVSQ